MGEDGSTYCRNKKLNGDGSTEEIGSVMIYNLGLTIGLSVSDIDMMTIGEIIDLAYYRANQIEQREQKKSENVRNATQADYDSF